MSDYGLIIGENENIQFDTKRQMLGLFERGYISETSWTPLVTAQGTTSYRYSFPDNYNPIAIAIKPPYSTFVVGIVAKSSDFPGGGIIQSGRDPIGGISYSETSPVDYAIYTADINQTHSIPNWGLVTYNENGEVVFNSDIRYLKITDIIDVNRTALLNFENVIINHSVQNPFYIIPYSYCETWEFITGGIGAGAGVVIRHLGIRQINSTSAQIGWFVRLRSGVIYGSGYYAPPYFRVPNPLRIAVCVL